MKKAILLCTCMVMLTGCWDKTELKKLGIILGIAIDKDPNTGEYIFTSQILRPAALSTQSSSTASPVKMVITTGKTVFEALRKADQEFDRKGFYAHNKVILISEELAKEGMLQVLDSFQRGKKIRGYVFICITKNAQARQILASNTTGVEPIPAFNLKGMIENTDFQLNAAKIILNNFYKEVLGSGMDPVVGVLEFAKDKFSKKHVKLSGGAVFRKDKLMGFLNEKETRGYLWGKGEVETGVLAIPSIINKERFVSIEVEKANAKIRPIIKGDEISFTISVNGEGSIVEEQSTGKFKSKAEEIAFMRKLEGKMNQLIEKEVKMAVNKAQKKFQSDVFGFGRALNKGKPKTWNKVKKNWNERYTDVPYTVNVNFSINSSGLMQGPFQPGN